MSNFVQILTGCQESKNGDDNVLSTINNLLDEAEESIMCSREEQLDENGGAGAINRISGEESLRGIGEIRKGKARVAAVVSKHAETILNAIDSLGTC